MQVTAKDTLSSGRRDKLEIMAAIVALTREPAYIWQISRRGNFSHPQLKLYLTFMNERGLIEKRKITKTSNKTTHVCVATEKGFDLLKIYCDSLRLLYREDYLKRTNDNLAVTCLQFYKEPTQTQKNSNFTIALYSSTALPRQSALPTA
jgi:predicted transcriptional regulator